MADLNPFPGLEPYPMMFDPSQWSNKYNQYQGVNYNPYNYGNQVPTDALGRPIQTPQGLTLNSAPQQPAPRPSTPSLQSLAQNNPMLGQAMAWQSFSAPEQYGAGRATGDPYLDMSIASSLGQGDINAGRAMMAQQANPSATSAPQQQPQAAPNNAYLQALANPGPVTTPGAAVPAGGPQWQPQGQSVLNAFLANRGASPGAGVGGGFINNLMRMRGR